MGYISVCTNLKTRECSLTIKSIHQLALAKRLQRRSCEDEKHEPQDLPCAGGVLSTTKRRKHNKSVDPIKGGFMKAPRRGDNEPLTEMEQKAEEIGKRMAKKQRKLDHSQSFVPKRNVRKKR